VITHMMDLNQINGRLQDLQKIGRELLHNAYFIILSK
jgi:hypothetical protein